MEQQEPYFLPLQRGPQGLVFDGKRMRKAIQRKTVDYSSPTVEYFEARMYQRDFRDFHALEPDPAYIRKLAPPICWDHNPSTSITTKFVHSSVNKVKCPINCVTWTPEGRRLITGASSGEFTLWNGFTFNFETILQAHDTAIRSMEWSNNDQWMITGDHEGIVKYWQTNMNNVKAFSAHKEAVRDITFAPSDMKFATCSDDVSIKIWDFTRCAEETVLTGHGWDVKCVDWHPVTSLLASGSKDNLVKLWDPKSGKNLTTIHGHKNTILAVEWNRNGNWLLTGSRDQLLKIFDIRTMRELQTFRGHKKEVTTATWHPVHEDSFTSGGYDGSIIFWRVGLDSPQGSIQNAHESSVWDMAWHPLGHILCSGSNDHTTKFWCRNRPGDAMKDKYNEVKEEEKEKPKEKYEPSMPTVGGAIPGLGQNMPRRWEREEKDWLRKDEERSKKTAPQGNAGSREPSAQMHIVPPPSGRGSGGSGPVVYIPGAPNAPPVMPPAFAMPPGPNGPASGMPPLHNSGGPHGFAGGAGRQGSFTGSAHIQYHQSAPQQGGFQQGGPSHQYYPGGPQAGGNFQPGGQHFMGGPPPFGFSSGNGGGHDGPSSGPGGFMPPFMGAPQHGFPPYQQQQQRQQSGY